MTNATKAAEAVDRIIADLTNRRGLRHEWDGIDDDIRGEIREKWGALIAEALPAETPDQGEALRTASEALLPLKKWADKYTENGCDNKDDDMIILSLGDARLAVKALAAIDAVTPASSRRSVADVRDDNAKIADLARLADGWIKDSGEAQRKRTEARIADAAPPKPPAVKETT